MTAMRLTGLLWAAMLALQAGPAPAQEVSSKTAGELAIYTDADPLKLATWVSASGDANGRPFVIVDKLGARVLAFDAAGALVGETPALLGAAQGDVSPPGVGTMRLAEITAAMRITPAGRYDAHLGMNLAGHPILWVDYDAALSLHPVVTGNRAERRLQRLATPSILDNRISYGCINVPALFYQEIVEPLFRPANGIVYILPEAAASNLQ